MMQFGALTCELSPGDRIVLVTDGVTEAASLEDYEFGDERLETAAGANDAFETLFSEVTKFCGETPLNDDCTVVEIVFSGTALEQGRVSPSRSDDRFTTEKSA
jgi:serine phosphatase RsbU (regulator of sigma subunit)